VLCDVSAVCNVRVGVTSVRDVSLVCSVSVGVVWCVVCVVVRSSRPLLPLP